MGKTEKSTNYLKEKPGVTWLHKNLKFLDRKRHQYKDKREMTVEKEYLQYIWQVLISFKYSGSCKWIKYKKFNGRMAHEMI